MKIGDRIRKKREELGMSQDELAEKVGYKSRSSINKIEKDGRGLPQSKILLFAKALNTTPAYLMGWENETAPVSQIFNELYYLKHNFENFPKLSKDIINSKEIGDAVNKIMDMNNAILNSPRTTCTFSTEEALIGIKFLLSYYHINWRKYDDSTLLLLINSSVFKNFIINMLDTFMSSSFSQEITSNTSPTD